MRYDGDGDLDVVLTANNGPAASCATTAAAATVLRVRTVGTKGNRDGIGAKVVVSGAGVPGRGAW